MTRPARGPDAGRPGLALSLLTAAAWAGLALAAGFWGPRLVPGAEELGIGLAVIGAISILAGAALAVSGGATARAVLARPRAVSLLILPALLTLLPFAGGFALPGGGLLAVLLLGEALTGFAEELVFRGFMLDWLAPRGTRAAAAISAVLFGATHLPNILIRHQVGPILGQAVGAACFGFAYAALRHRTGSLWPLMVLHFATDLFLRLGGLPVIPVAVAQDVVLLGYGLWLFRDAGRA